MGSGILALAVLLMSSSPLWAQTGVRSPQGGPDGGGGETIEARPLTEKDLQSAMRALPVYLKAVLNHHEIEFQRVLSETNSPTNSKEADQLLHFARLKMFPVNNARNVFTVLKQVRLSLRDQCFDLYHVEKDGTSFNADPEEICFSRSRLMTKSSSTHLLRDLIALAVHELGHQVQANESECVALQNYTLQSLPAFDLPAFNRGILNLPTVDRLTPGWQELAISLRAESTPNTIRICRALTSLHTHLVNANTEGWKISNLRFQGLQRLHASVIQVENMTKFCGDASALEEFSRKNENRNDAGLEWLQYKKSISWLGSFSPRLSHVHGKLINQRPLDLQLLRQNFELLQENLNALLLEDDLRAELLANLSSEITE